MLVAGSSPWQVRTVSIFVTVDFSSNSTHFWLPIVHCWTCIWRLPLEKKTYRNFMCRSEKKWLFIIFDIWASANMVIIADLLQNLNGLIFFCDVGAGKYCRTNLYLEDRAIVHAVWCGVTSTVHSTCPRFPKSCKILYGTSNRSGLVSMLFPQGSNCLVNTNDCGDAYSSKKRFCGSQNPVFAQLEIPPWFGFSDFVRLSRYHSVPLTVDTGTSTLRTKSHVSVAEESGSFPLLSHEINLRWKHHASKPWDSLGFVSD